MASWKERPRTWTWKSMALPARLRSGQQRNQRGQARGADWVLFFIKRDCAVGDGVLESGTLVAAEAAQGRCCPRVEAIRFFDILQYGNGAHGVPALSQRHSEMWANRRPRRRMSGWVKSRVLLTQSRRDAKAQRATDPNMGCRGKLEKVVQRAKLSWTKRYFRREKTHFVSDKPR